jgi:hypothetical protein
MAFARTVRHRLRIAIHPRPDGRPLLRRHSPALQPRQRRRPRLRALLPILRDLRSAWPSARHAQLPCPCRGLARNHREHPPFQRAAAPRQRHAGRPARASAAEPARPPRQRTVLDRGRRRRTVDADATAGVVLADRCAAHGDAVGLLRARGPVDPFTGHRDRGPASCTRRRPAGTRPRGIHPARDVHQGKRHPAARFRARDPGDAARRPHIAGPPSLAAHRRGRRDTRDHPGLPRVQRIPLRRRVRGARIQPARAHPDPAADPARIPARSIRAPALRSAPIS